MMLATLRAPIRSAAAAPSAPSMLTRAQPRPVKTVKTVKPVQAVKTPAAATMRKMNVAPVNPFVARPAPSRDIKAGAVVKLTKSAILRQQATAPAASKTQPPVKRAVVRDAPVKRPVAPVVAKAAPAPVKKVVSLPKAAAPAVKMTKSALLRQQGATTVGGFLAPPAPRPIRKVTPSSAPRAQVGSRQQVKQSDVSSAAELKEEDAMWADLVRQASTVESIVRKAPSARQLKEEDAMWADLVRQAGTVESIVRKAPSARQLQEEDATWATLVRQAGTMESII